MKSLLLTITERCNLNCVYCYEQNKGIGEMRYEDAMRIIADALAWCPQEEELEIGFHGGEPFLRADWMMALAEDVMETYPPESWHYHFFATTNGTTLSESVKTWLANHKDIFICCLSIDGDKQMQDENRSNSFDLIDLEFFRNTWPKQEVKLTISERTIGSFSRGIIFLHNHGFIVADNMAYGINWLDRKYVKALKRELAILVDYYLKHPEIKPCRMLDYPIAQLALEQPEVKTCGIGPDYRAYYVDGKRYPCHFFQPNSVGKEKAENSLSFDFDNSEKLIDPECCGCEFLPVCPTCYGSNYFATNHIWERDKVLCEYIRACASATANLMVRKIQRYSIEALSESKVDQKALLIGLKRILELETLP